MKWKVEVITDNSNNILIDDPSLPDVDKDVVGMGLPRALAERIVDYHNQDIEN
jgi:hypothetical protein